MTQKVLKVGDSAAVTIPKRSLEELGPKVGEMSREDKKVVRFARGFINRYRLALEALAKK